MAAHFDCSDVVDATTSRRARADVRAILAQPDSDDVWLEAALTALATAAPQVVLHVLVRDAELSWHLASLRQGVITRHDVEIVPGLPEALLAAELLGIFREPSDPDYDPVAELRARWEPRAATAELQAVVSSLWPGQGGMVESQAPHHPERVGETRG